MTSPFGSRSIAIGPLIVNSGLNAVSIYERFGFVIAAPKLERRGGAYVPMIFKTTDSN
jgi:hypothetical protein